jgi:hypothetical protein
MKDTPSAGEVYRVPRSIYFENQMIYDLIMGVTVGRLSVIQNRFFALDPLLEPNVLLPEAQFRYVIVPAALSGRIGLPDLDDYESVCEILGIEP